MGDVKFKGVLYSDEGFFSRKVKYNDKFERVTKGNIQKGDSSKNLIFFRNSKGKRDFISVKLKIDFQMLTDRYRCLDTIKYPQTEDKQHSVLC